MTCGKRSFISVCFYGGLVLLFVQILIVIIILNILEDPVVTTRPRSSTSLLPNYYCLDHISDEIKRVIWSTSQIGLSLILLDKQLLVLRKHKLRNSTTVNCADFTNAVLAVDYSAISERRNQVSWSGAVLKCFRLTTDSSLGYLLGSCLPLECHGPMINSLLFSIVFL